MRKFFTLLLFGLSMLAWPAMAQEIDESYVFMDEEGNIIENGATVVRNVVESFDEVSDVIYSGISVLNLGGSTTDHIKMNYVIERIDNARHTFTNQSIRFRVDTDFGCVRHLFNTHEKIHDITLPP